MVWASSMEMIASLALARISSNADLWRGLPEPGGAPGLGSV
jgi:hypothetical protein